LYYFLTISFSDDFLAHVPDVSTPNGLLDVILVGNIIEFADALSRPYYAGKVPKDVLEEENVARWRYRQLIRWIANNFVLVFENSYVNPWYLVHMSIAQFAATLCAYMETWKMKGNEAKGCTPKKFRLAVFNHLRRQWLGLIPKFDELSNDQASPTFAWNGPEFQVLRRNKLPQGVVFTELADLESYKVSVAEFDNEVVDTERDSDSELTNAESTKDKRSEAGEVHQDPDGEEERPAEEDERPVEEDKRPAEGGEQNMLVDGEAIAGSQQQSSEEPTQNKRRLRSQSNGK
jgi:hypothetical protein